MHPNVQNYMYNSLSKKLCTNITLLRIQSLTSFFSPCEYLSIYLYKCGSVRREYLSGSIGY